MVDPLSISLVWFADTLLCGRFGVQSITRNGQDPRELSRRGRIGAVLFCNERKEYRLEP